MFKVGDYVIPRDSKTIKVINEIEEIENQFIIYMTDNSSYHISQLLTLNEVVKKEGDLYVAINVENQQRRIIRLDQQVIENLKNKKKYRQLINSNYFF